MAKVSRTQRTLRLQDTQVGDLLAPMRVIHGSTDKWTGTLRGVTKVTAKRIFMGNTQIDKDTGREVGGVSGAYYVIATPERVAEFNQKQAEQNKLQREREAFHAREDYSHASAIGYVLQDMTIDNHPLDRLTPEEWQALRIKICGPVSQ
jgi:hypothetical protein